MKNTIHIIGIAALVLAGMTTAAMAQGRGPRRGNPDRHFAALGLSAQQKLQIEQLREAAASQAEPLHQQMAAKAEDLRQIWAADRPDKGAIVRKQAEMDGIKDRLRGIWTDFRLQVHAVLTPEQRAKWAERAGGGPGLGGGYGRGRGWMNGGGPGGPGGGFVRPDCPYRAQ